MLELLEEPRNYLPELSRRLHESSLPLDMGLVSVPVCGCVVDRLLGCAVPTKLFAVSGLLCLPEAVRA